MTVYEENCAAADRFMRAAPAFVFKAGEAVLPVAGASMLPLIREGERVSIFELGTGERIRAGDVYAFVKNGSVVLHRVFNCKRRMYMAFGDNSLFPEYVKRSEIIARSDVETGRFLRAMLIAVTYLLARRPAFRPLLRLRRKAVQCILKISNAGCKSPASPGSTR